AGFFGSALLDRGRLGGRYLGRGVRRRGGVGDGRLARGRGGVGAGRLGRALAARAPGEKPHDGADDDERGHAEQDEVRNLVDHGTSLSARARTAREASGARETTLSSRWASPSA